MHKNFVFLKRLPATGRRSFHDWWLTSSPQFVKRMPAVRRHTISLEADGDEAAFDGLAEIWFDDEDSSTAAWNSPAGKELEADMRAHASRLERLDLAEHAFLDTGLRAPFKLIAALKRSNDLTRGEFAVWWLKRHAPLVVPFPELRRYSVNIVTDQAERFVDGVAEVAFADLESLKRITSTAQVKNVQADSQVHTSARYRMLVEEHPIFR